MYIHKPISDETEAIVAAIYEAAFRVHRTLGPGLLESVYEICLCHELAKLRIRFSRQAVLPIIYDGIRIDAGLRLDVLVEDCVVVELKSVEQVSGLHQAQLLTYLRLSGNRIGLLINFNSVLMKDGITRMVY